MMATNHLGTPEHPQVHPVVASAAREVLNQISKAYGENNAILDNCHVRIA